MILSFVSPGYLRLVSWRLRGCEMDDKDATVFAYVHTPSVSGPAGGGVARIARSGLHAGFYSRSRPQLGGHLLVYSHSSGHAALAFGERTNLRPRSSSFIFCRASLSVMRLPRLDRNPCDNRSVHRRGLCSCAYAPCGLEKNATYIVNQDGAAGYHAGS